MVDTENNSAKIPMEELTNNIKEALTNQDQGEAAKLAKAYLEKLDQIPLKIAITGESGSGKSTLVNALRGVDNADEEAAPTGVVETTMDPKEYSVPKNPNILIWDLPGVGTTKYKIAEYVEKMEFDKFDFFILISSERFKENDAKLAEEIKKKKKKFYFIRSKVDHNIADAKRSRRDFTEESTLKQIKDNCIKELQQLGNESPKVFLVSSFDLHLFEFNALWKTLEKELPEHQRDALLLVLPNISLDVVKQKVVVLEEKIKWRALASAAGAAMPIPGSSIIVDIAIIVKFIEESQNSLGLTEESLQSLSHVTHTPIKDIKAEMKSPLAGVKITTELVLTALRGSISVGGLIAAEEGFKLVPFLGIPFSMSLSGLSTYLALKYLLKSLAVDAQSVFIKAMGLTSSV